MSYAALSYTAGKSHCPMHLHCLILQENHWDPCGKSFGGPWGHLGPFVGRGDSRIQKVIHAFPPLPISLVRLMVLFHCTIGFMLHRWDGSLGTVAYMLHRWDSYIETMSTSFKETGSHSTESWEWEQPFLLDCCITCCSSYVDLSLILFISLLCIMSYAALSYTLPWDPCGKSFKAISRGLLRHSDLLTSAQ